jgi:hypothetical protein
MQTTTRNRQARLLIWRAMARMGEFTLDEVAKVSKQTYGTVHKYVAELKAWDYVTCVEPRLPGETDKAAIYRLAMHTGPHAPQPTAEGMADPNLDPKHLDGLTRTWLAMRQLTQFDSPTLQSLTGLKQQTVETYVNKFLKAGLVAVVRPHRSGSPIGSYRSYTLVRNLGPLAPVFRRDGSVFDPNAERILSTPRRAS